MVSFSYTGNGSPFKKMRKHFMAPKRVLWRRWRWPLLLALVPTALVTWAGVKVAPNVEPFNDGWRSLAVGLVLFACASFLWYLVNRWRRLKRWAHGPFPPPEGREIGWYLREPTLPRRIGLLIVAVPMAFLQFWAQAAHDGGHTLDGSAALGAFFAWSAIIRGLTARGEPAIAVTASGVFGANGFHRWEDIQDLRIVGDMVGEDKDDQYIMLTMRDGQQWYLELPTTTLKPADVYGVINYYLVRPGERAGIPAADRPALVMRP